MVYLTSFFWIWISFVFQLFIAKYMTSFFIPINFVFVVIGIIGLKNNFGVGVFAGILGGILLDVGFMNVSGINTLIGLWIGGALGLLNGKEQIF